MATADEDPVVQQACNERAMRQRRLLSAEQRLVWCGSPQLALVCAGEWGPWVCQLRTSTIVRFAFAALVADGWIHVWNPVLDKTQEETWGMDIRIADIVWVQLYDGTTLRDAMYP